MQILELKLKNFKKFKDLNLKFKKGINIILGNNEAGKSTVSKAILEALFADPSTKSKTFFQSIYPWDGAKDVYLEMIIESGGKKIKIVKDFSKGEALMTNLDTGKYLNNIADINLAVSKILGVPSRKIFESTAYVRQSDVTSIDTSDDFINAIQQVAISSGNKVNVQKILKDLNGELRQMRVGLDRPAKNPGFMKLEMNSIDQLESTLRNKKEAWQKVNLASKDQKVSSTRLEEVSDKIAITKELIENNRTLKEATKKINDLDLQIVKYEESLSSVRTISEGRNKAKEVLGKFREFATADLEQITRKLMQISESKKLMTVELTRLRTEWQQQQQVIKIVSVAEKAYVKPIVWSATILIVGIVLGIIYSFWLGIIAIVLAMSVGISLFSKARSTAQQATKADNIVAQDFDYHISELEKKLTISDTDLAVLLKTYKQPTIETFFTNKAKFLQSLAAFNELEAQLKGLLGGANLESIEAKQLQLIKQKKEVGVNELTEAVKNSSLSPERYLAKTRELERLYTEKQTLEIANTTSKVRVEDSTVEYDDIVKLEEKLDMAVKNLEYLKQRESVLMLTVKFLQKSIEEIAAGAGGRVSAEIEKYLPKLTDGRYKDARLTEKMGIEIFSAEKNDWIDPVKVLSVGTVDQIYLLVRLAFLQNMLKGLKSILILDDPFVTFDSVRLNAMQEILSGHAEIEQILLLTHDSSYGEWGGMSNNIVHMILLGDNEGDLDSEKISTIEQSK